MLAAAAAAVGFALLIFFCCPGRGEGRGAHTQALRAAPVAKVGGLIAGSRISAPPPPSLIFSSASFSWKRVARCCRCGYGFWLVVVAFAAVGGGGGGDGDEDEHDENGRVGVVHTIFCPGAPKKYKQTHNVFTEYSGVLFFPQEVSHFFCHLFGYTAIVSHTASSKYDDTGTYQAKCFCALT